MTTTVAPATVLVIGTADTKGEELEFIRAEIEATGNVCLTMDVGVLSSPSIPVGIDQHRVADAAGSTIAQIAALGGESLAMQAMARGAARLTRELIEAGDIEAVLAIGGTMGTDLALEVMAGVPIGVPKMIASTVAFSHLIPPERVSSELMMILWTGGLWGLNSACQSVLRQASAAICGAAVAARRHAPGTRPIVGITSLGTSGLKYAPPLKAALEARGFEVLVFHTVGLGGRALEQYLRQGRLAAVLDLSLIEVSNKALGSPVSAGADRLEAAGELGVPQIVAPGAVDCMDHCAWDVPEGRRDTVYEHNRLISVSLTSPDDRRLIAQTIAAKLNRATGPTHVVLPRVGVDEWDRVGAPLHDAHAQRVLVDTLSEELDPQVSVDHLDAHINDPEFTAAVLAKFDEWLAAGLITQ